VSRRASRQPSVFQQQGCTGLAVQDCAHHNGPRRRWRAPVAGSRVIDVMVRWLRRSRCNSPACSPRTRPLVASTAEDLGGARGPGAVSPWVAFCIGQRITGTCDATTATIPGAAAPAHRDTPALARAKARRWSRRDDFHGAHQSGPVTEVARNVARGSKPAGVPAAQRARALGIKQGWRATWELARGSGFCLCRRAAHRDCAPPVRRCGMGLLEEQLAKKPLAKGEHLPVVGEIGRKPGREGLFVRHLT